MKIDAEIHDIDRQIADAQRRREQLNERKAALGKKRQKLADALKQSEEAMSKVVRTCFEWCTTDVFAALDLRERFDSARIFTQNSQ